MTNARFSVNVSMLFRELPFLERFSAAAACGFSAVEFWWPRGQELRDVVAAVEDAGVAVATFTVDPGDDGTPGLVCDPSGVARFRDGVLSARELARRLSCHQLYTLVGRRPPGFERREITELARKNLAWAASTLGDAGLRLLVEPVNDLDNPGYLVPRVADAAALVAGVDERRLGLLVDVYHMQRMGEPLAATIGRHRARVRHVHIADVPGRGEPGTGSIDFERFFADLARLGYDGGLGLEYLPTRATADSFGWREAACA